MHVGKVRLNDIKERTGMKSEEKRTEVGTLGYAVFNGCQVNLNPRWKRIESAGDMINWMKIVNIVKRIYYKLKKLRPGDFIRKLYEGISGRIKAFNFAFLPISCKVLKRPKLEKSSNDTQIEEAWDKHQKTLAI